MTAAPSRSWRLRAACAGEDHLFFAAEGAGKRGCGEREIAARALCVSCPVRPDCLGFALRRTVAGIWGGLDEKERTALAAELGIPRLCPAGEHVMAGGNVYVNPAGSEVCRACRNEADKRSRARKAAARRVREAAA